jgi:catechol 2,3-dioxygenase-like lactoylglutathione lyase family enzyme
MFGVIYIVTNESEGKLGKLISGIQQVGIGVPDVHRAWAWYRKAFGIDVKMFEERAEAALMQAYTGNAVHSRHAALALHMGGGGGLEIWQFTSRSPQQAAFVPLLGDTGVFILKIKCKNAGEMLEMQKARGLELKTQVSERIDGSKHYYLTDPHGFWFELVESEDWFGPSSYGGGVGGAVIGVSDVDRAMKLYGGVLGYDQIIQDKVGVVEEWGDIPGGNERYRRVILKRSKPNKGPLSELLGSGELELVQALDRTPKSIFADRFWGDLGYIHLCFDVRDMKALEQELVEAGFPFTVDSSNSFDMGEASGQFSYIEDPDGTLIEFVETHKFPIVKNLGWYLDVRKRNQEQPLPKWMLRLLALNRVKD